ncbi:MAG: UDP-N-acetylmuramoyl-tripeptide--D-alanyl-D-alanine ligase [bacterium]
MKKWFLKFIYRVLASYAIKVINLHKPFVIAISGSVGKSSAKEVIAKVLSDQFGSEVRANYGNLNAHIGIPLTILGYKKVPNIYAWPVFLLLAWFRTRVKKYPKYLILEMGIDKPGDIEDFMAIVRPNIVVITNLDGAHLENFASIEEYRKEKLKLFDNILPDGKIIVNFDDEALQNLPDNNIVSVSLSNHAADYRIENYKISLRGTEYRLATIGQKISIKSKVLGKHFIYSQLFAFAIANIFGINFLKTKKSLEEIEPYHGRMSLLPGVRDITIIDDTYNANPTSMRAALDTLAEINYNGRKVAILGNMNELGKIEQEAHINLAKYAESRCDFLILVGRNSEIMYDNVSNQKSVRKFSSRQELLTSIDQLLMDQDLVLIKASQNGNYFEEIVKYLLKDKKNVSDLLVRQSKFWMSKKN